MIQGLPYARCLLLQTFESGTAATGEPIPLEQRSVGGWIVARIFVVERKSLRLSRTAEGGRLHRLWVKSG